MDSFTGPYVSPPENKIIMDDSSSANAYHYQTYVYMIEMRKPDYNVQGSTCPCYVSIGDVQMLSGYQ